MKEAQKPNHISLMSLIGQIKAGRYVIPDFQREFEWKPGDIRDLVRSIFLDYYIGSLLLWNGRKENFDALSCEPLYGFRGESKPEYIVLDGQQRLTAMYYAFVSPDAPLPGRSNRYHFFVRVDRFMADEYDVAFDYQWSKAWADALIGNTERQYAEHIFPLKIMGEDGWALPNWLQGYEKYWQEAAKNAESIGDEAVRDQARLHAENAGSFGKQLRDLTEKYQISYIELDRQLEIDKVCEIFTQINSKGVQLDTFDLINALLKPRGLQLKKKWREAAPRLSALETDKMNVYILQVMSILRQGYCSPKYLYFLLPGQEKPIRDPDGTRRKEILVADVADFEQRWDFAVNALETAIRQVRQPQEFGAASTRYLPYVSILPAFAAIQAHVRSLPANRQLEAQRKVRHWYWASVFLNRYSGAVESTAAKDFLDLKAWLESDETTPSLIGEFLNRFRQIDFRKELKRGTSVYNGIFNLFVIQGARDWMTGNIPHHEELDDHHIIPASKYKELGAGSLINTILNRSPLSADTNRKVIRERWPYEYLPDLMKQNGEGLVRSVLESHFISPAALQILLRKPFLLNDYEAFIAERQRTLLEAIESLLIKDRLDLAPQLRELDGRIENVELGLRKLVAAELGDDISLLPSHVQAKLNERIVQATRKNAAIDAAQYNQLYKRLEFGDLKELQDSIITKALWPRFEGRFQTTQALATKFEQFTGLRNSIRHSRSVDEVTRKEGEAAILWFEQLLQLVPR